MAGRDLVLIADDSLKYREYLAVALGGGPYGILEAADGDQAWALLVANRPAVAVLDLEMPGRSGLDLVRAIRADPALRSTYVVVLTGARLAGDAAASLAAGADRHLTKPYPSDALRRAVAQGLALTSQEVRPPQRPEW
jgi:CheY-like chemotaxis protein